MYKFAPFIIPKVNIIPPYEYQNKNTLTHNWELCDIIYNEMLWCSHILPLVGRIKYFCCCVFNFIIFFLYKFCVDRKRIYANIDLLATKVSMLSSPFGKRCFCTLWNSNERDIMFHLGLDLPIWIFLNFRRPQLHSRSSLCKIFDSTIKW